MLDAKHGTDNQTLLSELDNVEQFSYVVFPHGYYTILGKLGLIQLTSNLGKRTGSPMTKSVLGLFVPDSNKNIEHGILIYLYVYHNL